MDEILIVKARDVLRLNKFRYLWVMGWLVATAALVVATFQIVRVTEYERQLAKVEVLAQELEKVQAEQKVINESYVKAWENQQQTADLLVTWGTFVKERTDLINRNTKNAPINLVRR